MACRFSSARGRYVRCQIDVGEVVRRPGAVVVEAVVVVEEHGRLADALFPLLLAGPSRPGRRVS